MNKYEEKCTLQIEEKCCYFVHYFNRKFETLFFLHVLIKLFLYKKKCNYATGMPSIIENIIIISFDLVFFLLMSSTAFLHHAE